MSRLFTQRPIAGALCLAAFVFPSPGRSADLPLNGHTFTLPDGFTLELVASTDLVPRPVTGSFDPNGRLYVTDSAGLNLPPSEQLKDPQNRVLRLEDTDNDGRFDRVITFADRVMFPQGCLWHDGSVYVAAPPSIWKFTDTNGDGVADRREEWYQGNVLTGCANDVHGPHLGPEGMLYWTKGAFARLDLKDGRGQPIQDRCAHVFRAWPDKSGLESVMSGGMDNPVEVTFTADGEPIVISTFIDLSQPGRRDGIVHAVYGGVFGKSNDVVDEPLVKRTGDLMPVLVQAGPAAACAITRYTGEALGPDYQDNLFATLFNLRKVTRHQLSPNGASYTAESSDFLVSDHIDFHPTDVFEDADGSLLVIDTGGWYKLCCPSSQLAKADVLGGIYRVRRSHAPPRPSRDALRAAYARLTQPPPLRDSLDESRLKRIALAADPAQAPVLRAILRQHASAAGPTSARLARLAAEGLGRMRDPLAVPLLVSTLTQPAATTDRFLEHSLLFALIEIGDAQALSPFLLSDHPAARRAALLALEQIDPAALNPSQIIPALISPIDPLRATARWIARRHPDWAQDLANHLRARLESIDTPAPEKREWQGLFGLIAPSPAGQNLLARVATEPGFDNPARVAALQAMAESRLKSLPAPWHTALLTVLRSTRPSASIDHSAAEAALRALRSLPLPREGDPALTEALRAVTQMTAHPPRLRLLALAALPAASTVADPEFELLRSSLDPNQNPSDRLDAAQITGRLRLAPPQLERLTDALRTAGPLELPRLLPALASGRDDALGRKILAALGESRALRSLRTEDLLPHLASYPDSIRSAAESLLLSVRSDASQDRLRLDQRLAEIEKLTGDIRRGQALFNSTKAACASCHRLGYLGGDVGPDLTSIGTIRSQRDLLEAVLYPSASFVRSYEPWIAETRDGEEFSGVLRRETPDEIVLATGPGAEMRIPRTQLTSLREGSLSTMPAGLDEQLSSQELADLLAFLRNTKWGAN